MVPTCFLAKVNSRSLFEATFHSHLHSRTKVHARPCLSIPRRSLKCSSKRSISYTLSRHHGIKLNIKTTTCYQQKGLFIRFLIKPSVQRWHMSWRRKNWASEVQDIISGVAKLLKIKLGPTCPKMRGDGAQRYQGGWHSSSKWRKVSEALKPRLACLLY